MQTFMQLLIQQLLTKIHLILILVKSQNLGYDNFMKHWEASSIFQDFTDYYKPFLKEWAVINSGELNSMNCFNSVVLPFIVTESIQSSFFEGFDSEVSKSNLFTNYLKSDRQYHVEWLDKNYAIFKLHDIDNFFYVRLVEDIHQFFVAKVFMSSPPSFVAELQLIALLKHFHFDDDFRLHLHERGGRPGKWKICKLGADCPQVTKPNSEKDVFKMMDIQYFEVDQRTMSNLKIIKDNIFNDRKN